jgi:mRNA deadenylase 3'-5' endonuclease subunit Ccr4
MDLLLNMQGCEPAVTNSDDSGGLDNVTVHQLCLDYFWYCPQSLEVAGVLETPSSESIAKHYALPSIEFPSDHIPLLAEFVFKRDRHETDKDLG